MTVPVLGREAAPPLRRRQEGDPPHLHGPHQRRPGRAGRGQQGEEF